MYQNQLEAALSGLWYQVVNLLPNLIMAIIILIIGFVVAGILKKIIVTIFNRLNVDSALRGAGAEALLERSGYRLNSGLFVGTIVKWFIIIAFFVAALDVLNLHQATAFLSDFVLTYLPRVIVATIILFVAFVLAQFLQNMVVAAAKTANFKSAHFLGKFAKFAVIFFAVLASLNQLQIATELVQMLFGGMVFAISLALGLAFGLGGREAAGRYVNSVATNSSTAKNNLR